MCAGESVGRSAWDQCGRVLGGREHNGRQLEKLDWSTALGPWKNCDPSSELRWQRTEDFKHERYSLSCFYEKPPVKWWSTTYRGLGTARR